MKKEKLIELREILASDAMVYPLKFKNDVNSARHYIDKAFRLLKVEVKDGRNKTIIELKKIHCEFENYDKLNKERTNYSADFEEKKKKFIRLLEDYISETANPNIL